jgi:hypothetical protein
MGLGEMLGQALGGLDGLISYTGAGPYYVQTQTDSTNPIQPFTIKYHQFVEGVQPPYDFVNLQQRLQYLQSLSGTMNVQMGKPPKRKFRGKVVTYMGEKAMQGYSMGEYNLYEVAAIVLPSKKGDFEGEGAKTLTFGESKDLVMLIVAPNADAAVVRASKQINEEYAVERLKVFVRPFVVDE